MGERRRASERGDGPCDGCGRRENIVWHTDSVFWNAVVRNHPDSPWRTNEPILCVPCFVDLTEQVGYRPTGWRLAPEFQWTAVARGASEAEGPTDG